MLQFVSLVHVWPPLSITPSALSYRSARISLMWDTEEPGNMPDPLERFYAISTGGAAFRPIEAKRMHHARSARSTFCLD